MARRVSETGGIDSSGHGAQKLVNFRIPITGETLQPRVDPTTIRSLGPFDNSS